jgi:hypothetical protein
MARSIDRPIDQALHTTVSRETNGFKSVVVE